MADVQPENGYTKIANELIEALARAKLNGTQRRILDIIIRSTYGWNKKSHPISLTFIEQGTGIDKTQIKRELKTLIQKQIVKVYVEPDFNNPREIGINKDYDKWGVISTQGTKKPPVGEKAYTQGTKKPPLEGTKKPPKKDSKEIYKEIYDYYLTLDLVKHKNYTQAMAKAIKKAMDENKYTVEDCKKLLKRHEAKVKASKNKDYPVKARPLHEFFGQKAYGATYLICVDYDDGMKHGDVKVSDKPKGKKVERKIIYRDEM